MITGTTGRGQRPNFFQRAKYLLGRPLPVPMRDWVRNDVTGPGWMRRYVSRGLIPAIPVFMVFALIPGAIIYRVAMIALLLIPLVYFQIALRNVYRTHLLRTNGLDTNLIHADSAMHDRVTQEDYERNYRQG